MMAYVAKHSTITWGDRDCLMSSKNIPMTGNDHALYHVIQQVPSSAAGTETILISYFIHSVHSKNNVSTMYRAEF